MPTILNLCRRGKQTFLCSLFFLPFIGYSPHHPAESPGEGSGCPACLGRSGSFGPSGTDTIGRKKDKHYRREVKEWNRHESDVIDRYLQLVQQKAEGRKEDQPEVLNERIRRLKIIVTTMNILKDDESPYYYIIRKVPSTQGVGETVYDPYIREIVFCIQDSSYNTYSFVHEVTHGLQFTQGEMVFDKSSGYSVGDDIDDELEAYKNQFAFDTESIYGIHSFGEIDSAWLRSLKDRQGVFLYSPVISNKYNVIGLRSVTVESDTNALKEAYPAIQAWGRDPFPLQDKGHFIFRKRKTS